MVDNNNWISVKDRLPEEAVDVLGWNGWDIHRVHYNALMNQFYTSEGTNKYPESVDIPITHWQPLPEPPVAEQEADHE